MSAGEHPIRPMHGMHALWSGRTTLTAAVAYTCAFCSCSSSRIALVFITCESASSCRRRLAASITILRSECGPSPPSPAAPAAPDAAAPACERGEGAALAAAAPRRVRKMRSWRSGTEDEASSSCSPGGQGGCVCERDRPSRGWHRVCVCVVCLGSHLARAESLHPPLCGAEGHLAVGRGHGVEPRHAGLEGVEGGLRGPSGAGGRGGGCSGCRRDLRHLHSQLSGRPQEQRASTGGKGGGVWEGGREGRVGARSSQCAPSPPDQRRVLVLLP